MHEDRRDYSNQDCLVGRGSSFDVCPFTVFHNLIVELTLSNTTAGKFSVTCTRRVVSLESTRVSTPLLFDSAPTGDLGESLLLSFTTLPAVSINERRHSYPVFLHFLEWVSLDSPSRLSASPRDFARATSSVLSTESWRVLLEELLDVGTSLSRSFE